MKKTEKLIKQADNWELPLTEEYWNRLETKIMTEVAKVEIEDANKKPTWAWWRWKLQSPMRASWIFVSFVLIFMSGWGSYQYLTRPAYSAESLSQSLLSTQVSHDFFIDIARENIDDQSIDDLEAINL